jgi:hypothetical protein
MQSGFKDAVEFLRFCLGGTNAFSSAQRQPSNCFREAQGWHSLLFQFFAVLT